MIINNTKKTYKISADLIPVDEEIIKVYIQSSVNAFCNNKDSVFSVRILFGGDNRDWNGTPLQKIYDYYIKEGKTQEQAGQRAAIDVGRLLKSFLENDGRKFETVGKDTGLRYKLVR